MKALLEHGRKLGLSEDESERILRLHRPASDASWVEARDLGFEVRRIANEIMESGRVVESLSIAAMMIE